MRLEENVDWLVPFVSRYSALFSDEARVTSCTQLEQTNVAARATTSKDLGLELGGISDALVPPPRPVVGSVTDDNAKPLRPGWLRALSELDDELS